MEKKSLRVTESNLKRLENNDWQLAYVQEFKDFVHQHPKIIQRVTDRLAEILNKKLPEKTTIAEGDLKVTLEKKRLKSKQFSIEVGDKKFFLKMGTYSKEGGYDEILSSVEAQERINQFRDLPIGVEVIEYQLGFSQRGINFFVAPWMDMISLADYERAIENRPEKNRDLNRTVSILAAEFQDYEDFGGLNMAYNPQTDKLVLFDLHKKRQDSK